MVDPSLGRRIAGMEYFDSVVRNRKRAQVLGAIAIGFIVIVSLLVFIFIF